MYMNIIYSHTLREVDRNKKYCIVLYCAILFVDGLMNQSRSVCVHHPLTERNKKNKKIFLHYFILIVD